MTITFYQSTAAPNELDKTGKLTAVATYSGANPNIALDLLNPVIVVEETAANIMSANYCYIEELGRYYHIVGKTGPVNGLFTVSCSVDPLMSFKTEILALRGIVSRNPDNYDMYLKDSRIPTGARKTLSIRMFPSTPYHAAAEYDTSGVCVSMLVLGGGE